MNDEIKEFIEFRTDEDGTYFYYIDKNGDEQWSYNLGNLKDYIINLQQENEYLKKQNDEKTKIGVADHKYASQMEDKVIELQQENERLKGRIEFLEDINSDQYAKIEELEEENERLKEENIEIRQCLLIKRRGIPHKLTINKSIEEILDMPTYEDYKSRCEKAIEYIKYNDDSLYTYEPDYDYEENLVDNYEPSNFREDLLNILQNGDSNEVNK